MSYQTDLTGLTTREAITDAIHRATTGLDNNDIELARSAFINRGSELVFSMGDKEFDVDQMLAAVGGITPTHYTTEIRIDIKGGADTAVLTAYSLDRHCKSGEGNAPGLPGYFTSQKRSFGEWSVRCGHAEGC